MRATVWQLTSVGSVCLCRARPELVSRMQFVEMLLRDEEGHDRLRAVKVVPAGLETLSDFDVRRLFLEESKKVVTRVAASVGFVVDGEPLMVALYYGRLSEYQERLLVTVEGKQELGPDGPRPVDVVEYGKWRYDLWWGLCLEDTSDPVPSGVDEDGFYGEHTDLTTTFYSG